MMETVDERIKMVDSILQRREEMRQAEE